SPMKRIPPRWWTIDVVVLEEDVEEVVAWVPVWLLVGVLVMGPLSDGTSPRSVARGPRLRSVPPLGLRAAPLELHLRTWAMGGLRPINSTARRWHYAPAAARLAGNWEAIIARPRPAPSAVTFSLRTSTTVQAR